MSLSLTKLFQQSFFWGSVLLAALITYNTLKPHFKVPMTAAYPNSASATLATEQGGSATAVISKAAMQALINQAAQQKYLQDVLASHQQVPLPAHLLKHMLSPPMSQPTTPANVTNTHSSTAVLTTQRCLYNGQSYVAGDIVKTDQYWIRCTPAITFEINKPTVPQMNGLVWVQAQ